MRNDAANPYRQLMFDLDDFTRRELGRAIEPEVVGELVARAATDRRPRACYYVPLSSQLTAALFNALPQRLGERLLRRVYGPAC